MGTELVEMDLSEAQALALLKRPDLSAELLTKMGKNGGLLKYRKVKLAMVQHPRTPRHALMPLLRQLFTFDLMRVALTPAIAADVKIAAEDNLIHRLEKLSLGERITLARRASGRIAAALLNDPELRVIQTALENGRLTESGILKEISRINANSQLIRAVTAHPKWSVRSEIAAVLLGNENTEQETAVEPAASIPKAGFQQVIAESNPSEELKPRIRDMVG